MAGLAGEDAKVQIQNTDGNGSWNELAVNFDATTTLSPNLLEDTTFGDESPAMIKGLIGASIDLTFRAEASASSAVADIRDAALDANATNEEIDIEYSPDGNTSSGPTDVIKFTAMPSEYSVSAATGDPQERTVTLEVSDGSKPTVGSSFS